MTGHIAHHAAKSLIFPLPVAGSVPKRVPLAWNAADPTYAGLGFRGIGVDAKSGHAALSEFTVAKKG